MRDLSIVLVALYDTDSFPVCTLHAGLKRAGFNVTSVFFKRRNRDDNTMVPASGEEIDRLVDLLRDLGPDLVGLCVRSVLFQLAAEITTRIKSAIDTAVIWGGIHPTLRPRQCLEYADIVCVGEGEETLLELANRMSAGDPVENVRNLWFKGDHVIENDLRPLIQDLDSIPFPDYSSDNKYLVDGADVLPHRHQTEGFMTSRGCPFSCTFCCNNALRQIYKGHGRYVRRRSVDNVIAELAAVTQAQNLTTVTFWDDVFSFDIAWLRDFCVKYKRTIGLPFNCYCHPKVTKEDTMRLLREAGLAHVGIGIQSGSEQVRHHYFERYDRDEDIISSARILKKLGIAYHVDILMDNPLEGERERRETFELLLKLPTPFFVNTHMLTHFPESTLTRMLLERRLIDEDDVEDVKQLSYTHWNPQLDLARDRENMFWANVYFLTGIGVPRRLVRGLSRSRAWKRHPRPLTRILRWLVLSPSGQRIVAFAARMASA